MKKLYLILKYFKWPIIALVVFLISGILQYHSEVVEKYYSASINKWMIQIISQVFGIFRFSVAEFVYIGHLLAIPVVTGVLLYKARKGKFLYFFRGILRYLSIVYLVFMIMWGFNYSRVSVAEINNLEIDSYTLEDLYQLNEALILKANSLRVDIHENEAGVMELKHGYQDVFARAEIGYQLIGQDIPVLGGKYGRPKPFAFTSFFLHTGISGMYFPFTGEPNICVKIPDVIIPATVIHEMAHQRGIASEDEANYLAYLIGSGHPDLDFQYSGIFLSLLYSMSTLISLDRELAEELIELYSEGLTRDLEAYFSFWGQYRGIIDDISHHLNDWFLKANHQSDGAASYGLMVNLLLAHYSKHKEI